MDQLVSALYGDVRADTINAALAMADLPSFLAVIEHDPDDTQAFEGLTAAARQAPHDLRSSRFAATRKLLANRGRPDAVVLLIDVEIAAIGDTDKHKQADLLLEKGMVLDGELLDVPAAHAAFASVLELRKNDAMAIEALEELNVAEENWQKFTAKYVQEATASTDRSLATGLYVSAAEAYVRFAPEGGEAEAHLRKALEIDPKNGKAAFHLARLLRRRERWQDLGELLDERAEKAAATEEKVAALIALSDIAHVYLGNDARSERALKRVLVLDATHPRALRFVTDAAAATGDWAGVVVAYQAALKARRDGDDLGMLLQIGMVLWKHLNDLDQAEEYFRRIRKIDQAHPAALDFYRTYYTAKGETGKLMTLLKSAEKSSPRPRNDSGEKSISIEIAELAEAQNNPEKAIEAWKQHLRSEPTSVQARSSLARLYRRTEKWNALLDLMKDEIDRLGEAEVAAKVSRLFEVAEIYRDRLKLDVMVINTYNGILKIDPDNQRAGDELAGKFRTLGRWNDLIAVLTRKSEAPNIPDHERVKLLREVADLWSERFGNFANAIKPLERIAELTPTDTDAINRLKEIYTKRRQWRQLIDLLAKEASTLAPADRRGKQSEMARLAAERLGDSKLAIEIHNRVLGEAGSSDVTDTLAALAALYDREKRHLAYVEIVHRQVTLARAAGGAANLKSATSLLEKLGQIYTERLQAPQQAAAAWKEILELEPNHAKALRTLRELYAMAGDFVGLEQMYARLGQQEELVDALLAIADRIDSKAQRLPLVERAAHLAQERSDKAKDSAPTLEKARSVWERVLAVDSQNIAAATALAPIYEKQEKWTRLLTMREIELGVATDPKAKLVKLEQIRALCEQKLASKTLAFAWALRAYELEPSNTKLYDDVMRLASERDQWRDVVGAFERAIAGGTLKEPQRLSTFRELAKIANKKLGDPEMARGYHRKVLQFAPEDRDAETNLEDLATQVADWSELLASFRRRAQRENPGPQRATLLLEAALIQEQKLVDLDGAAVTYREALGAAPGHPKALRALAKVEEARGDWESLADVLSQELAQEEGSSARFDLLMRLGSLEEHSLERPAKALAYYREALAIPAQGGGVRPQPVDALARLVLVPETATKLEPEQRIAAVREVLPHLEAAKRSAQQAAALEVLRASDETSGPEKTGLDRALLRIYHTDLGDPGAAWTAGLRVVAAQPQDAEVRHALATLAGQLGHDGEWGKQLGSALATLKQKGGAPNDVRAVATELAQLAGDRLADRATAEKAWMAVLEVEADASDAFDALSAAYRADQRWMDLRALLERRAEVTIDAPSRLAALLQLAVLEEQMLGEPVRAIAAYRRSLDLEPANGEAFSALDRLYTEGNKWPELEELLARRAEYDPAAQALAYRRAELFAHALGDPIRSIDLLEDVLARERGHADGRELLEELLNDPKANAHRMRISRVLEPLYEGDKLWKDLVGLLRVQRGLVEGTEAVELLARIAALEEAELNNGREAFDAWLEVLKLEPTDERARVELPRLAQWLSRWPEATAALENAVNATPASDIGTRGALLGELATYYDTQLGDAPRAIVAYRRLLDADQSSPATQRRAGAALARLYEENGAWQELRDVNRKQAEWAEDATERRALLSRVAQLEETKLGASEAAITTWRDVLHDQPHDTGALHALERLYSTAERWRDLVEILRRMADQSPSDAIVLLGRIAVLHELRLKEPDEAIAAWLEVLEHDGDNPEALAELARLYGAANRHADLLDVYERQLQNDPHGDTLPLQIEVAKLLGGPLQRPVEALDRWENVLHAEPSHPEALAAVEAALHDPDLRAGAADILRPVYSATAKDDRLASLAMRQSEWTDDPATKLRALNEVVLLREQRLGDKAGAFDAQLQALRYAATEPELARTVAETERLAGELGREAELIDVYRAVAPDVLDAEIQRRLYLDIADLARAVRRDLAMSREYYQKVLDVQPDDRRALAALESIYRETNDDEHLVEVLLRQATPEMGADIDDQVHALVEAAGIYANLKRPDEAIGSWQQVLEIAPERADAIYALEGLYSGQNRWHDVVDLYERRLGFVTSVDEAVALRVQLGELHEKHIHDIEAAIENYAAALGGNSKQPAALAALERLLNDPEARAQAAEVLEPVFVAQQRWPDLVRVYEAKLDAAADPRDRLRLTRFVARLFEEQLEDFENATKWFARVFREAPADPAVRDQLNRLASITENWGFVAETYQSYLDDEQGETTDVRDVAIAVATIYDRRLNDTDKALAAYRRALAIDVDDAVPNGRELVRRLEDLLGRTQRWPDLVSVYDDVISRGDDDLRIEALVKRARLVEDGLHDTARAVEAWREVVLASDSGDTPAAERAYRDGVGELERLFRLRSQWHDLVDLIEARLGRTDDETETAELRLRLADIYENQIQDLPAAIDQYQEVLHGEKLWERGVHALERLVIHDDHRARVIELLEPVYRAQDWWQKLVVILDAKLEYVMDPFDQVQTLHEIADLHETRGGAIDLALAALARAWRIDVSDDAALTKLLSLAGKLGAWDEAARTVEDGAASASNGELAAGLWARAAEIHEIQRRDRGRSIEAWRKVDEARTDDLLALAALDRLLALEGRVPELVTIVDRRAELTEDAGVRLVLLHRVAALYEDVLNDRAKAIGAYKNVLGVDDTDLAALDALERLYRADSGGDAPRELAVTLERKIELSSDVVQRQQLRHAAAQVYEGQLDDVYQAIGHLTAILDDDAGDQSALGDLDRIYTKQKLWPELLDTVDKRALLAANTRDRADLAFRAAKLVEVELTDPEAAIPRYGAVLQVLPSHEGARAALEQLMQQDDFVDAATPILERVYRSEREVAGLIRVYERRLHVEGRDPSARRADWQALAETREQLANQPAQAFVVWGRALADDPEDADLLQPLQRLAETQNLWRELAALLEERLEDTNKLLPPDVDQAYAMRLGAISEDRLNDLDRAARAFDRGTRGPEPRAALSALERVLARGNKSAELAAVLRRQADAAESEPQTAEYLFRMADLHETTLNTPREAVAAYRDVLGLSPSHPQARAALERMLGTVQPALKREIVEVLEPLFEQDDDAARLVTVLDARLAVTDDAIDRAAILQRLVEIAEHKLNDRARALDAALRWLAADPASQQALNESERLAERLGQWQETAQKLSAIVRAADARDRSPDVQVALLVFLGRIQRDKLGQAEEAIGTYRAALALEPEEMAALDPLIEILRMRGDSPALAEALRQRGKVAPEPAERRAAFAEVAQISERSGDRAAAVAAWREISSEDDNDRDALDQLARIYRSSGAAPDAKRELVDVLNRAARLALEPADEKQLRLEIARLESDTPRAVGAWQAVADLDPDDLSVLGQLELAHAKNNDWIAVGDIQTRRLDLAKTTADKVAIYAEMAQLAEGRRQSVDDAITAWYSAIEIDNTSQRAYEELERLLGASSRWHDLVELLERRAELYGTLGENHAEIQALARAADVWEAKLDNPDAAGEILEKILAREPGSVAALTRLSKIYDRTGDWAKSKATLEQALKLDPQGRDAADLFFRLGEVARVGDSDEDTAIQHFRNALRYEPTHAPSITALEKLARERRDNTLLNDVLKARLEAVPAATRDATSLDLLVEIAALERKAGRSDAALAALARAANAAPDDVRVLAPLADMFFAASRFDEAAPIYDRLATEAKTARRMKDVAKFRQRQGSILEARGDHAGAQGAYEEALRVNPTDVVTMMGLGRLYFAGSDWEKARKIYQSLVLQNIDADAGVTKGEVYWALGRIHIELGQSPKAKSMFQRGLEIEPGNKKLREALTSLA